MLALVRPDSWNFPLFLHVLGATLLVGAVGATVIIATRAPAWRRLLARTMGLLVLPAWVLMRFAGQWIDSRENIPDDPAWVGIGFGVGDAGLVLLVITALIAWWGVRRPERRWPVRAVAVISGIYLIALFVAMWAMTTKPD
jgi:quinol-cytochrome oxidoreductase complex cytochrome b subunit